MHKSVRRDSLGSTTPVSAGEVVVATEFMHPVRGLVHCPAADLLAAHLERAGLGVRSEPVTAERSNSVEGAQSLLAVSYLDRDGNGVGFGAVIASGDKVASRIVDQSLAEWTRVLRTRRINIASGRSWCRGVARALLSVYLLLDSERGQVYVYGSLTENPATLRRLRARGARLVDELDSVPDGATVVFAQHGVSLAVAAEAAARGMQVVDATCPLIAGAQAEVRRFADRGETVVVIGQAEHAAFPGLVGQATESVRTVARAQDVEALEVADRSRVAVVVQPGLTSQQSRPVVAAVRARFPHPVPQHPATACDAADDRQATMRAVSEGCDTVLVVCADEDPEAESVLTQAAVRGARAYAVTGVEQVLPQWIADSTAVGIIATMLADPDVPGRIAIALTGLGPSAIVERSVQSVAKLQADSAAYEAAHD